MTRLIADRSLPQLTVACYLLHKCTEVVDVDVIYSSKTMIALQWEDWGSTKFNRTTCECVATVFCVFLCSLES